MVCELIWERDNFKLVFYIPHFMQIIPLVLFAFLATAARGQSVDSSWLTNHYLPAFYVDTGTYLHPTSLVDNKGNNVLLSNYTGKILYIDIWSTNCAPCIAKFPYQEQLMKRLKVLQLDTAVLFININIEDSEIKWKKALDKYHPTGINLHSIDTGLYTNWNIPALPCYILLDWSEKVLGKGICGPDDAFVDWLLYCATKGVHPADAVWRQFAQNKLMEQNRSSSAFTDKEYAHWFSSLMPAMLEYNQWRKKQQTPKGQ